MVTAFLFFVSYLIVDTLCLVLTIIIASNVSRDSGSEIQVRYFFLVLTAYQIFLIFDIVWAFLANSGIIEAQAPLLGVVNGINLTAIAFAAYFWLCFTLARFDSKVTNSRSLRLLTAIPAILVPIIHIIGFATGQNVIALPDGDIGYGIAHTGIMCIQLSYIIAATAYALFIFRSATSRSQRHMSLVFMSFMLPFILAGIVDSLIAGTPVVAAAIMVSITFVMMSMQESRISSDALTGLNNRRRADAFLEESLTSASPAHPLYLFIIDLDRFKSINDIYGHLEGDHALRLTANALRDACAKTNAFAARWGGDEFIVIHSMPAGEDPNRIAELIKSSLANTTGNAQVPYDLTCSIGYASCESPDDSYTHLISQADEMLYENKRAR